MWILTQDKQEITIVNNMDCIEILENERDDETNGMFLIQTRKKMNERTELLDEEDKDSEIICFIGHVTELGFYDTQERAEDILKEIFVNYANGSNTYMMPSK